MRGVGLAVGLVVGNEVGYVVGLTVGIAVGALVGKEVGKLVGLWVTHLRLRHAVARTLAVWSGGQTVCRAHTTSLVAVHALVMYWFHEQRVVMRQMRFFVGVPAENSYSLARLCGQTTSHLVATGEVSQTLYAVHFAAVAAAP